MQQTNQYQRICTGDGVTHKLSRNETAFREYMKKYYPDKYRQCIVYGDCDVEYCDMKKAFQQIIKNERKEKK